MRKTGIDIIDRVPWSTHFCQFYRTRQDLADILVPYFKAGLENNEFCLWITSPDFTAEEAEAALRQAVPDFERCRQNGQIEILPHTEWYLKGGAFDPKRVLNGWVAKCEQALANGFAGLRLSGNTGWIEKKDWKGFADYEQVVNEVIGRYRILALCTYSLEKCGAIEVLDVVRNHQFALIKSQEVWRIIESPDDKRRRAEQALRESEERLRRLGDNLPDSTVYEYLYETDDTPRFLYISTGVEHINGVSVQDVLRDAGALLRQIPPEYLEQMVLAEKRSARELSDFDMDVPMRRPDGQVRWMRLHSRPRRLPDGRTVWYGVQADITERRQAEESLRESQKQNEFLAGLLSASSQPVCIGYLNGRLGFVNRAFEELTGYTADELRSIEWATTLTPPEWRGLERDKLAELNRIGRPVRYEKEYITKNGKRVPVELLVHLVTDSEGGPQYYYAFVTDISERKQAEANRVLLTDSLRILNRSGDLHSLVGEVLCLIRDRAGFDAVGLRLRRGEDCPYYEQNGFSEEFLREENFLCARCGAGAIVRDAEGRAVLECTCGLVLSGRTDPGMPCFTKGGSFWSNHAKELLALAPAADPRDNPRNRCIHAGYQSVGLFPVLVGQEIVGLLQLNDRREGRFAPRSIAFYESLAQNIGLGLQRAIAEEAARAVSTELRTTLDTAATGLIRCGRDLRFRSANPAYVKLIGLPLEQIVGRPLAEVVGEEAFAMIRPRVERVLRGERVEYEAEMPFSKAGARHIHVICTPEEDSNGKIVGWVASITDITERKRVEEAVRRAEALLAQAVELAGLGIFEHDHRSGVIEYSPLLRRLLNFDKDETITIEAILQRIVPEDRQRVAAAVKQAHDPAGTGRYEIDYRVMHGEGNIRWVSRRAQTFFEGEGSERRPVRSIGIAMDVTERREVQASLERLVAERTAKLRELVGELEHFSYSITHDMRAPLRAMQGFADMMTESCGACQQQEPKMFLRRIATSAARMDSLITDALNYSRAVRQELTLAPVDAGALLRGMLDSYPELQPAKAQIEIAGAIPLVMGNEAGLTQCFSNLLGNAVKFVKQGQKPQIRIWAERREGVVRIWVEDNGIGIPSPMLTRVFDMFARGHQSYEGTGIGLALVRKVMDRMGGKVGVESQEGNGSRFWLDLKSGDVRPRR